VRLGKEKEERAGKRGKRLSGEKKRKGGGEQRRERGGTNDSDASASQHGDDSLRDHWHIDHRLKTKRFTSQKLGIKVQRSEEEAQSNSGNNKIMVTHRIGKSKTTSQTMNKHEQIGP